MKALLINGSPRKNGNTSQALKIVGEQLQKHQIDVKYIQLGGINIKGCQACQTCLKQQNQQCIIQDDLTQIMVECFSQSTNAIIIGSPTYFSNVTSETKAFIDRVGYVSKCNHGLLKNKIGAPIVIDRRAGANFVYAAINFFYGINEMPIATSSYWNSCKARKINELVLDKEGIDTLQVLGNNLVKLMQALNK
ncbi:MAG: flavodoxin family protein [Mycoplasmataceae bacterium]|jgi:multimeric flavodoxin WrbA|nr:flavodoxin family protein [Mycoplasmataceae bacterium]